MTKESVDFAERAEYSYYLYLTQGVLSVYVFAFCFSSQFQIAWSYLFWESLFINHGMGVWDSSYNWRHGVPVWSGLVVFGSCGSPKLLFIISFFLSPIQLSFEFPRTGNANGMERGCDWWYEQEAREDTS